MKTDKILVVLPHPDDEVFPMSGTLAKYIETGSEVVYACLTLGQMGRNLGNPPFANRVTLPAVREKELRKSCSILGIEDLRLLGFHDKTIEFEPHAYIDGVIAEVIDSVNPDVIFTFYPGFGVHPDHNACGAAVIRVVHAMEKDRRPVVLCTAMPTGEALRDPDIINQIDEVHMEKKLGAMQAHSSQFRIEDLIKMRKETKDSFMQRIQVEKFWIYDFDVK